MARSESLPDSPLLRVYDPVAGQQRRAGCNAAPNRYRRTLRDASQAFVPRGRPVGCADKLPGLVVLINSIVEGCRRNGRSQEENLALPPWHAPRARRALGRVVPGVPELR